MAVFPATGTGTSGPWSPLADVTRINPTPVTASARTRIRERRRGEPSTPGNCPASGEYARHLQVCPWSAVAERSVDTALDSSAVARLPACYAAFIQSGVAL